MPHVVLHDRVNGMAMKTQIASLASHKLVRSIKWFMIALIFLAVLLALVPPVARMAIVSWLEQQGVTASIEKIDIGYVDGTIDVINAEGKNPQGHGFAVAHLHVDFSWQALFDKVLHIDRVRISGLTLDTVQHEQGLQSVAGIDLTAPAADTAVTETTDDTDTGTTWRIRLGPIQLTQLTTCHQFPAALQHVCLQLQAFDWQGQIVLDPNQAISKQLSVSGTLDVRDILFEDKQHQQTVVMAAAFQVADIQLHSLDAIMIKQIAFDKWQLFPAKTSDQLAQIVQLNKLQLDELAWTQNQLALKQITVGGLGAYIQRNKNGQWQLVQHIEKLMPKKAVVKQKDTKATATTKTSATTPTKLAVKVKEIQFKDGQPLVFIDNSLSSALKVTAQIKKLQLSHIDTANEQQSSKLVLHIVTDQHGDIDLSGKVQLLAKTRSFDMAGEIKGLDLRPVGAYLESGVGHRVKSGQLNAQLKLVAKNGKLNSELGLDLKQFQLKKKTKGEADVIDEALGMPVDSALNLLRNRDNSIQLAIPITGDVDNPEFDPSDAIYKATSKAITSAIISYYTPFGLVTAVEGLINLATAIRFETVLYEPASDVLSEEQKAYLDKMLELLTERPQLHLSLCGFSNQTDLMLLLPEEAERLKQGDTKYSSQDQATLSVLSALAARRAEAVKLYLVEKGIGADRLILCEGEYDSEGIAGVDISI